MFTTFRPFQQIMAKVAFLYLLIHINSSKRKTCNFGIPCMLRNHYEPLNRERHQIEDDTDEDSPENKMVSLTFGCVRVKLKTLSF